MSIGGALLCVGHLTLALKGELFFYFGLTFIILGVGLLKPNISTLVGNLYQKTITEEIRGVLQFSTLELILELFFPASS